MTDSHRSAIVAGEAVESDDDIVVIPATVNINITFISPYQTGRYQYIISPGWDC